MSVEGRVRIFNIVTLFGGQYDQEFIVSDQSLHHQKLHKNIQFFTCMDKITYGHNPIAESRFTKLFMKTRFPLTGE